MTCACGQRFGLVKGVCSDCESKVRFFQRVQMVNRMQTDGTFVIAKDEERDYTLKGGVLYIYFHHTGEWRPASRDVMRLFDMAENKTQEDARDAHTRETIREYRKAQANRTPEQIAESRAEARAAHGPGQRIVNIFTGESWTT